MNRQIIHYKITFTGPGNEIEIRHLVMETISYHNYLYFIRKLIALFPVLEDHPYSVNWKDKEGDLIRICSDDELSIALDEMKSDPVKKIFVIVKQQGNETMLYPEVVCDGCDEPIKGFRYKCLVCSDFDLCSDCERFQTHPDHAMIRIPKPLSPETPSGKQFTNDISKISQHLEHLFQQTDNDVNQPSDQRSQTGNSRRFKFCQNDAHNIISNLLVEKLIKFNNETSITENKCLKENHASQTQLSSSCTPTSFKMEPQNTNVLISKLKSLSINADSEENERLTKRETNNGGQRTVTCSGNPSDASFVPSTTGEAASSSDTLQVNSIPRNKLLSEIDATPILSDPTPVLQAQLTPPLRSITIDPISVNPLNLSLPSAHSLTAPPPVPLSKLIGSAFVEDFLNTSSVNNSNSSVGLVPPSVEDDGSLDNSWAIVRNEQSDPSVTSSDSIVIIESSETTPLSTPEQIDSPPVKEIGPYEESITMLHTLGFEKKDWLNLVVEAKKGDIEEVLKFLSPIKKKKVYKSS